MKLPQKICPNCGALNDGRARGSGWIAFLLLCCWIVPGIIYIFWQHSANRTQCTSCRTNGLVMLSSPRGAQLYEQYHRAKGGGA